MKCNLNNEDLVSNFNGTICRYKDVPVIVEALGNNYLNLRDLLTNDVLSKIRSTDPLFDISTPPLGYAQYSESQVVYVTRQPKRMWKQGLTDENIKAVTLPKGNNRVDNIIFNIQSTSGFKMMSKNYPSFKTSMQLLAKSGNPIEIAISNSCALKKVITRRTVNVYFKNEIVGFIPEGELTNIRSRVIVPNSLLGKIVSLYLKNFDWEVA